MESRDTAHTQSGFSLAEVLIALVLVGICIVPMMNAFAPAIQSSAVREETAVFINQARGTLFRVSELDFLTLYDNQGDPVDLVRLFENKPAEAAKETFTFGSASYTPRVSITNVSGGIGGLLEIRVTVDRVSLALLRADY